MTELDDTAAAAEAAAVDAALPSRPVEEQVALDINDFPGVARSAIEAVSATAMARKSST